MVNKYSFSISVLMIGVLISCSTPAKMEPNTLHPEICGVWKIVEGLYPTTGGQSFMSFESSGVGYFYYKNFDSLTTTKNLNPIGGFLYKFDNEAMYFSHYHPNLYTQQGYKYTWSRMKSYQIIGDTIHMVHPVRKGGSRVYRRIVRTNLSLDSLRTWSYE